MFGERKKSIIFLIRKPLFSSFSSCRSLLGHVPSSVVPLFHFFSSLVQFVENRGQRDGESHGSECRWSLVRDPAVAREELALGMVACVLGAEAEVHLDLNLEWFLDFVF